jgi:hypothetical protein
MASWALYSVPCFTALEEPSPHKAFVSGAQCTLFRRSLCTISALIVGLGIGSIGEGVQNQYFQQTSSLWLREVLLTPISGWYLD